MSQRGRVCIFVLAQALTQAYQLYAIRILKWETSAIAVKLLLQRFRTIVARNGSPAKMKSRLWLNLNYDDFLSCHYIFVERQRKAKGGESWEIAHTDIMTSHLTFAFQGVAGKMRNVRCDASAWWVVVFESDAPQKESTSFPSQRVPSVFNINVLSRFMMKDELEVFYP